LNLERKEFLSEKRRAGWQYGICRGAAGKTRKGGVERALKFYLSSSNPVFIEKSSSANSFASFFVLKIEF